MKKADNRPRLIVWQLEESGKERGGGAELPVADSFSTKECMLTIDSIARTSKTIVVLTGPGIPGRSDLLEIVEYGFALGLKIIIEAAPGDLTEELLQRFKGFGGRVFRIMIDGCIGEGEGERYEETPQFLALEECVHRVKRAGYGLHLGMSIGEVDARRLAVVHDYAFRRGAEGIYFHLDWAQAGSATAVPDVIDSIARIKEPSPREMYFSPQCIRYARAERSPKELILETSPAGALPQQWCHSCAGGKSYAYISPAGEVRACRGLLAGQRSLRSNGYNFKQIWEHARVFEDLRSRTRSCAGTRNSLGAPKAATKLPSPIQESYA